MGPLMFALTLILIMLCHQTTRTETCSQSLESVSVEQSLEGDSVLLDCAYYPPNIQLCTDAVFSWYKNNEIIPSANSRVEHIATPHLSDEGNYRCGINQLLSEYPGHEVFVKQRKVNLTKVDDVRQSVNLLFFEFGELTIQKGLVGQVSIGNAWIYSFNFTAQTSIVDISDHEDFEIHVYMNSSVLGVSLTRRDGTKNSDYSVNVTVYVKRRGCQDCQVSDCTATTTVNFIEPPTPSCDEDTGTLELRLGLMFDGPLCQHWKTVDKQNLITAALESKIKATTNVLSSCFSLSRSDLSCVTDSSSGSLTVNMSAVDAYRIKYTLVEALEQSPLRVSGGVVITPYAVPEKPDYPVWMVGCFAAIAVVIILLVSVGVSLCVFCCRCKRKRNCIQILENGDPNSRVRNTYSEDPLTPSVGNGTQLQVTCLENTDTENKDQNTQETEKAVYSPPGSPTNTHTKALYHSHSTVDSESLDSAQAVVVSHAEH